MSRPVAITSTARAPWPSVERVLGEMGDGFFGVAEGSDGVYVRTISAPLTSHGTVIARAVRVDVHTRNEGTQSRRTWWDIDLRAVGDDERYPVFEGTVALGALGDEECYLELSGAYDVPLGVVGRLGDRVIGHRFAEASLETLLHDLASSLEQAVGIVEHPAAAAGGTPAPAPESEPPASVTLPDEPPDLYLG